VYASGKACKNKAYYVSRGTYLCGQHTSSRTKLPQLSAHERRAAEDEAKRTRDALIAETTAANKAAGRRGQVALFRMGMMKAVVHRDGFQTVFPNNKHAHRTDGLGMATLSPMQLGPVVHGQPGLPDARNLENAWQQSKQLEGESDAAFLAAQRAGFADPVPHRHKVKGAKVVGWIWVDADGKRHVLDRVTARQFYCNWYERLARKTQEWATLEALVAGGTSVLLCGYDGYAIPDIEAAYLNKDITFGHEAVLYTMLHSPDPESWPWRKRRGLCPLL
jgi:hypothetical protein